MGFCLKFLLLGPVPRAWDSAGQKGAQRWAFIKYFEDCDNLLDIGTNGGHCSNLIHTLLEYVFVPFRSQVKAIKLRKAAYNHKPSKLL